jgi:hypothetical protein
MTFDAAITASTVMSFGQPWRKVPRGFVAKWGEFIAGYKRRWFEIPPKCAK